MLAYFSLSVPAGLGVYWITNNLLSTVTTLSVKEYFKRNPVQVYNSSIVLPQCLKSFLRSRPSILMKWSLGQIRDIITLIGASRK